MREDVTDRRSIAAALQQSHTYVAASRRQQAQKVGRAQANYVLGACPITIPATTEA